MKLEILAKRIAEKTATPVFESVLLGAAKIEELPEHCTIWNGAYTGKTGPRVRKKRGYDNIPDLAVVVDRPRAVINFKGKRHSVQRLLYSLIISPDYPYRLESTCGEPLCVNPVHYVAKAVCNPAMASFDPNGSDRSTKVSSPVFSLDEPWTAEEVGELVEIALTEHTVKSWQELVALELLIEAPRELIDKYLRSISKEHLRKQQ